MKRIVLAATGLLLTVACSPGGPESGWATESTPDTVDVRRVASPLDPSSLGVSPDGRALVGGDPRSRLLSIAELGGSARALETGRGYWPGDAARWSKDGRRVAYNWYDEPAIHPELRINSVDGGPPRVVLDRSGYALPLDWSPDGMWLAVVEFGDDTTVRILLVPTTGGEPLLVRALDWRAPHSVSFSPDGQFLAFDVPTTEGSLERDIAVYDLRAGREQRILDDPANDLLLGWSPTGELYFLSERAGLPAAWRVAMAEGRPSGAPELVKRDFLRTRPVGFTASGDFFYSVRTGGAIASAASLDAEGVPSSSPRALTAPGDIGQPNFIAASADGRLLSYVSSDRTGARRDNERGGTVLDVVGIDGSQKREFHLPPRIRNAGLHRWLPDGSGLVFRGNEEGRYGIFRLDFASGDVELLLSGGGLDGTAGRFRFDLTPDGRDLVYIEDLPPTGNDVSRLVVRSLGGGPERVLLTGRGSGPIASPVVSPDGRQVAFYGFGSPGVGSLTAATGQVVYDLMLLDLAGGEPRRIGGAIGGSLAWAPDGSAVLVSGAEVTRIPVDGGSPSGLGIGGSVIGIDPRGRTLLLSTDAPGQNWELWLMSAGGAR